MSQLAHGTGAPRTEGPGDAELISAVRGGDIGAYGELFERHVGSARRLARQLVSAGDVDDLVSEAFAKVLRVLQRGGGPDLAFRAYLLTSVRRLHVDKLRAGSRLRTTDDLTPYDPGVPFRDTAVEGFESAAAARAFASLPERWQMVLWHTEVEGQKPADVALLLGMTANSVAALAYRAREGLRQAFVSMHAQEAEDDACIGTQQHLGAYIRGGMSRREAAKVESHLGDCRRCTGVYLELTEVNSNLRAILAPLVLGSAAAAYVGSLGGIGALAVVKGGVLFFAGRARDLILANAPVSAVAGVAATAAVATGVVMVVTPPDPQPIADRPGIIGALPASTGDGGGPSAGDGQGQGGGNNPGGPGTSGGRATAEPVASASSGGSFNVPVPLEFNTPTPTDEATDLPSETPTDIPTDVATDEPSDVPTESPTEPVPTEPADHDLSVVAHSTALAGLAWQIDVDVNGLPAGEAATVTLSSSSLTVALTLDPRCMSLDLVGGAHCQVQSPANLQFLAVPIPGSSTTLTFTVAWDDAVADPDPSNNTTTVDLHS